MDSKIDELSTLLEDLLGVIRQLNRIQVRAAQFTRSRPMTESQLTGTLQRWTLPTLTNIGNGWTLQRSS
jgi:hypothetical protein